MRIILNWRPPRGGTALSRSTDGCSNFCNELSRGVSLGRGTDHAQPGIDRAIRNAGIDRAHQRTPYRSWVHPDVSSSEAHFLASLVNVTNVAYDRSSEAPLSLVILVVMLFSLRSNTITPKGIHNYPPNPPSYRASLRAHRERCTLTLHTSRSDHASRTRALHSEPFGKGMIGLQPPGLTWPHYKLPQALQSPRTCQRVTSHHDGAPGIPPSDGH